jgi:branched-subunit amino acid transport protein
VSSAWWAIILAAIGTYTMRAAFLVAAPRMADLPVGVQRVLRQIPPAALAAIVVPELLRPNDQLDFWQPELAAGLVAALVFWRTKSTALTLVVGMVVLTVLRHV